MPRYFYLLTLSLAAAIPEPKDAVAAFAAGDWEALHKRFTERMRGALPPERLKSVVEAQAGSCKPPAAPPVRDPGPEGREIFTYRIDCEKRTVGLRLTVETSGEIAGLFLVEPPAAPGELVVVTDQYRLPARITTPAGPGPWPAVVLVHGSGPHDMDETIGPNKVFLDIAEGLAKRGVAAVRYVKRTKQYAGSLSQSLTLKEETIEDAVSAVKLLRATPRIDSKRIYIVGHSLGAYAAPRIAAADPSVAGLVLLAGNTRPIDVLIDEQVKYLGGTPEQAAAIKASIGEAYRKDLDAQPPVPLAATLKQPMLILQGERDYQVTMEDFAGWRKLAGPRVTLKSYPKLNHLFQEGEGKSTRAEYAQRTPFSDEAIADIAKWIASH